MKLCARKWCFWATLLPPVCNDLVAFPARIDDQSRRLGRDLLHAPLCTGVLQDSVIIPLIPPLSIHSCCKITSSPGFSSPICWWHTSHTLLPSRFVSSWMSARHLKPYSRNYILLEICAHIKILSSSWRTPWFHYLSTDIILCSPRFPGWGIYLTIPEGFIYPFEGHLVRPVQSLAISSPVESQLTLNRRFLSAPPDSCTWCRNCSYMSRIVQLSSSYSNYWCLAAMPKIRPLPKGPGQTSPSSTFPLSHSAQIVFTKQHCWNPGVDFGGENDKKCTSNLRNYSMRV